MTRSRLTAADGLLLLRAFSPYLFTMGTAVGPSCLLDFLRQRFQQASSQPSLEKARAQYDQKMEEQEVMRQKRKQDEPLYQCHHCESELPVEAFGADRNNPNEEYSLCMEPGHWRECTACEQTLIRYCSQTPRIEDLKMCVSCTKH